MKFNQNDNELLYLVAQKDEDAKNTLYRKYKSILLSLSQKAYHLCQEMNGAAYEDFFQEACYGFERAIASFDETKDILFYTYVMVCVKNQLTIYQRKISRKKEYPLNYALSLNEEIEEGITYEETLKSPLATPYEVCERKDFEEELRDFKNKLPFLDACVFELRYNGFAYQEIADLLDIKLHKVSHIMGKIKEKAYFFQFAK